MVIFIISIITFFSTFLGGVFALTFKSKIKLIMAFSAGVILGLIAFEILPEIFELSTQHSISLIYPMITLLTGFFIFHFVEKFFHIHACENKECNNKKHSTISLITAIGLIVHSFLDGFSIGSGFKLDLLFGVLISIAVIGHDFADGLNTVSLILRSKNSDKKAVYFLIADSLAPVFGVIFSFFIDFPITFILLYLGYFAGSLLYISTSDILPQAHKENGFLKTIILSLIGVLFMFLLTFITKDLLNI